MEILQPPPISPASYTPCKKVIFMAGAGHSGSTLLGMMLGSGKGVLFAGEAVYHVFLNDMSWGEHKRSCRVCGINCPIWGNFVYSDNVYQTLSQRSGRPIIIDSSKKPTTWAQDQSADLLDAGTECCLLFIIRDPRAVVASNLRKDTKGVNAHTYAEAWAEQMRDSEKLAASFRGKVVKIGYEELAAHPEETLKRVCSGIDIPFDPAMLHPWEKTHHPLRGNAGTQSIATGKTNLIKLPHIRSHYVGHTQAIVLDERWKNELDTDTIEEIKAGSGEMYVKYVQETPIHA